MSATLGTNPFMFVDEKVKDEAFASLRGKEVEARKEFEQTKKQLKGLWDEFGSGEALDLSKITSLGEGLGDGEKAEKITQIHSRMAGAVASLNEVAEIRNSKKTVEGIDIDKLVKGEIQEVPITQHNDLHSAWTDARNGKAVLEGVETNNFECEVKLGVEDIMNTTTTVKSGAGQMAPVIRPLPGVVMQPERPTRIIDIMPRVSYNQNSIEYLRETTTPPNMRPAVRAEEGSSNEMQFAYTKTTAYIESISGNVPVTREALMDVAVLPDLINNRARFFALQALDTQVATGNGTRPNLQGVENAAASSNNVTVTRDGSGATAKVNATSLINGVLDAATNILTRSFDAYPDYVIMHPIPFAEAQKANTSGIWQLGGPASITTSMWTIPIVQSSVFNSGAGATGNAKTIAVAGNFRMHSRLYMRENVMIETGYINDDLIKHIRRIQVSLRAAPVWFRDVAFSKLATA